MDKAANKLCSQWNMTTHRGEVEREIASSSKHLQIHVATLLEIGLDKWRTKNARYGTRILL